MVQQWDEKLIEIIREYPQDICNSSDSRSIVSCWNWQGAKLASSIDRENGHRYTAICFPPDSRESQSSFDLIVRDDRSGSTFAFDNAPCLKVTGKKEVRARTGITRIRIPYFISPPWATPHQRRMLLSRLLYPPRPVYSLGTRGTHSSFFTV